MAGRDTPPSIQSERNRFIAYAITNRDSGKAYIGITTQKNHKVRWDHHCNVGRRGIGAAIKKYGRHAFVFEVIASSWDISTLLELEAALILQNGTLSPGGYNLNVGGKGTLQASAETKALIASANSKRIWSDESRVKSSSAMTGRKMPESHRQKRRAYMIGRKPTDATRAKLREQAKLRVARPEWLEAVRRSNSTRIISLETRAKIAASLRARAANTHQTELF